MWRRRYLPLLLGLTSVLLLAWLRVADPYPVRALREIGFDVYQQIAPRPDADHRCGSLISTRIRWPPTGSGHGHVI